MLAITGASGQLGRLVIEELLKTTPAKEIVAVARSVNKIQDLAQKGVQVRHADYNQPDTLVKAFAGIEKVLLISSSEVGRRFPQHKAVIDAAKQAGVKLIAYTSILHADTSLMKLAEEHKATEQYLKNSGVPFVLLRNSWYTENYAASIPAALQHGAMFGCAGDGKISSAARADYAAAAATVMTLEGQAGRIYELAGDQAYTLSDFADEVSRQSGKKVAYKNLSESDYKAALLGAGLPEPIAALLSESDTGASKGGLFDESKQLSALIGRPTTPLSVSVRSAL